MIDYLSQQDSGTSVIGNIVFTIFMVLVIAGGIAAYLIPTIIAVMRKVPNVGSVAVINILLGWLMIGWVVALAMAVRTAPVPPPHY